MASLLLHVKLVRDRFILVLLLCVIIPNMTSDNQSETIVLAHRCDKGKNTNTVDKFSCYLERIEEVGSTRDFTSLTR
jgi:hypothetical protein